MKKILSSWELWYADNLKVHKDLEFSSLESLQKSGFEKIKANVPCVFETALKENGVCGDMYDSVNSWNMRKYETYHQWYATTFDCPYEEATITFEGIDTIADIYLNGEWLARTENMFIPHSFDLKNVKEKGNELIVHIHPVVIEARKYKLPTFCYAGGYTYGGLSVRKSIGSFGWDILPRTPCGGLWREVFVSPKKKSVFKELYLYTTRVFKYRADSFYFVDLDLGEESLIGYELGLKGICGDSTFEVRHMLYHTIHSGYFGIANPKTWMPVGYGEQNLYDVTITLYKDGKEVESTKRRLGVRRIKLLRTSVVEEHGRFDIEVNGKRIHIKGMNWVPIDALYQNEKERTIKTLEMIKDIGCNLIRVWGGGTYCLDEFYDWCDEHGILVWQDFMLACGIYPEDERFINLMKNEAEVIIKKLRDHASLALWSGDNEGDMTYMWQGIWHEPFHNKITRGVFKDAVRYYDAPRSYLPSSPYIDEKAYGHYDILSEDHVWGTREYFKSDFYRNNKSYFISEIGYPALSSPKSLRKFIQKPWPYYDANGLLSDEYRAHVSPGIESNSGINGSQCGRAAKQVKYLFGKEPDNFNDYVKASQISQAEAYKFFIERMRIKRDTHGGIILWNMIESWPKGTDNDVVDYYFNKKLSYHYIKRSNQSVCLMCEEEDGCLILYAVNDMSENRTLTYTVKNVTTGKIIGEATQTVHAESSEEFAVFGVSPNDESFYYIEWTDEKGNKGSNHFHTNIKKIDFESYIRAQRSVGFDEFSGFEEE